MVRDLTRDVDGSTTSNLDIFVSLPYPSGRNRPRGIGSGPPIQFLPDPVFSDVSGVPLHTGLDLDPTLVHPDRPDT